MVIKGDEKQVEALYRTLEELVFLYREGSTITESQVRIAAKLVANGKADAVHTMFEDTLSVNMRGKILRLKRKVRNTMLIASVKIPLPLASVLLVQVKHS